MMKIFKQRKSKMRFVLQTGHPGFGMRWLGEGGLEGRRPVGNFGTYPGRKHRPNPAVAVGMERREEARGDVRDINSPELCRPGRWGHSLHVPGLTGKEKTRAGQLRLYLAPKSSKLIL